MKRKEATGSAVFPCVLRIIQIFRTRDPIILGVDVVEGSIRVGTPLAAVKINETTKERTIYSLGKMYILDLSPSLTGVSQSSKIIKRWRSLRKANLVPVLPSKLRVLHSNYLDDISMRRRLCIVILRDTQLIPSNFQQ